MMIEVNKELYLDNGDLGKQAEKIKQVILEIAVACG